VQSAKGRKPSRVEKAKRHISPSSTELKFYVVCKVGSKQRLEKEEKREVKKEKNDVCQKKQRRELAHRKS